MSIDSHAHAQLKPPASCVFSSLSLEHIHPSAQANNHDGVCSSIYPPVISNDSVGVVREYRTAQRKRPTTSGIPKHIAESNANPLSQVGGLPERARSSECTHVRAFRFISWHEDQRLVSDQVL